MARRGSHWGSFGKGFMDSLLAVYKIALLREQQEYRNRHWQAQEDYWRSIAGGKNATARGIAEQERLGHDDPNYHPDQGGGGGDGGYKGGANAEAHAGEMADYLQQTYGLSKAGAAAMVGNAWQENSFRTGIEATGDKDENGNYTSGGMFQWHGSRLVDARNWMQANDKDPRDWRSHMDYAIHDMQVNKPGLFNYLKTTDDAEGATHTFFKRYEIGDPAQAHMGNRVGMANAVFSGAARTKTAKGTDTTEPSAKVEKVSAQVPPAGIHIPNVYTSSGKSSEYPAKTETGGTPTSQADLPPGNQVASLDDDEAMRIAIEQQNQARSPDQRNMDPATINEQAEQAGHYAFTHSGEPTPATPVGAGPAIPISPQAGPGGPNPNFQPSGDAPPQQGPGGPNPTPGPMFGPPPPPTAGPPVASLQHPISKPYPLPYESGYPEPASTPIGGGAGNVMEKPSGTPADANAPSANASPAEITRQSNPLTAADPRFVQIYQPNIARTGNAQGGRGGDSNAPMMGALNLSWGPNLPVDQRGARNNIVLASSQGDRAGQTVPAPMPPPRPSDAPDMSALPDNYFDVTAARKGGPMRPAIPRYAGGGGVMGYASGGATLGTPATMAQLTSSAYAGPTVSGGWIGTPYAQLAPNQQAWADQQTAEIGKIRGTADPSSLQFTMMPDAVWPTAATPATPTTVNQPPPVITPVSTPTPINTTNDGATGGTTTGAYQLPDIVAPVSTPGVDDNTTTTTAPLKTPSTIVPNTPSTGASDVGSTDNTKKPATDTSDQTGTYAGFQRGGIPRRPTRGRYAGGGMVTNFAAGGGAPTAAMLASPGWQNTASTYTTGPNTAPLTNQQLYSLQQTINSQPAGMFMGSYSDWLTGANNSQNPAGASRDLTNYYGAYAMPAPAAAAPTTVAQPAPVVTPVSTPTAVSTTSDAANGGTTTGAYQLPDVVAPASTPALDTTQNTTTVNPTPKTPTTIVPNITTSGGGVGIDQPTTTVKPLKTPSTTATGGGAGASDFGNTDYGDTSNQTGSYAGFSRGGIPRRPTLGRYAGGGGVMGYAAGATVQQVNAAMDSVLFGPNAPYSQQQVMTGVPDQSLAGMYEANFNALTPEQQTWYNANQAAVLGYNNATGAVSASYTAPTGERGGQAPAVNQGQLALANNQQAYYQSQFNLTPPAAKAAAAAATAAPAATTPAAVVTPTLTAISTPTATSTTSDAATGGTTTGAYQLPDIVAPTSTPSVDQTGTTVNPTPKVPTTTVPNTPSNTNASDIGNTDTTKKQTPTAGDVSSSSGAYAGFRRGGVIGHNGAMRYDDGGGVSPAPAGMLPGMGGSQPIPPIYYNPATYAGAGAPVGKGVTATSAPTYVAGAIPTLPMFRGGRVQRYDDGGDVQQPDPNADLVQSAGSDYDPGDAAIEADIRSRSAAENAPPPQGDQMPAFTGYFTPGEDQAQPASAQGGGAQDDPHRPANLPPYAAQGTDGYGNPSNGFISALVGGIHWLADHLGVSSAQAGGIAPDAQTQQNRQMYVSRANMMTRDDREQLNNMADPHHTLDEFMRNIHGMEQAYRWLLAKGDINDANKMAASVLQYDVANANDYQEEAAKRYYDGDLPGAVKAINAAADAVPTSPRFHAELAPDGKNLIITGSDLSGRELWKQVAAPAAILSAVNPSLPWTALENQAAKYDPNAKAMAAARRASQEGRAENEVTKQMYAGEEQPAPLSGRGSVDGFAAPPAGDLHPTLIQAQAPQPAIAPPPPRVSAFQSPTDMPPVVAEENATLGGTGGAQGGDRNTSIATPPPGADTAQGPGPAIAQGPGPAPGPTPEAGADLDRDLANIPNPQVQDVRDQDIVANTRAGFFDDQGRYRGGPPMPKQPDQVPGFFNLSPQGQKEAWTSYGKAYQARHAWEMEQQNQYGTALSSARERARLEASDLRHSGDISHSDAVKSATQKWQEKQATLRNERSITAAKTAAGVQQQHELNKEAIINYYKNSNPLTPEQLRPLTNPEMFGGKIEDRPDVRMARALGIRIDEEGNINSDDMKQVFPDGPDEWVMAHHVLNSMIAYTTHGASPTDLAAVVAGVIQRKYALQPEQIDTPAGKQTLLTVKDAKGTPFMQAVLPKTEMDTLIELKKRAIVRYNAMTDDQKQRADAQAQSNDLITKGTAARANRPIALPQGDAGGLGGSTVPTQQVPGVATPASKPFFGTPSYAPAPAISGPPPNPYAPDAPPPGVGQGFRLW